MVFQSLLKKHQSEAASLYICIGIIPKCIKMLRWFLVRLKSYTQMWINGYVDCSMYHKIVYNIHQTTLLVSSLWWMNITGEEETCFLPIFPSILVDLYWDEKWNSDAFAVKLFLRDTLHSLVLLKDIGNLWDKTVVTSGQQLMETGDRGIGFHYLPVFLLHSCFTDSQKTVSVVGCP